MDNAIGDVRKPDKKRAAICGLFCTGCDLFIGTTENPESLQKIADTHQIPVDILKCHGCRTDVRCFHCTEENCKMIRCSKEKGIDFCVECEEYPCADFKDFQAEYPHRIELFESQERIKEVGWEKWYTEQIEHYSCPECRTLNSPYDATCRKCGASPGSEYMQQHKEEIVQNPNKSRPLT